MAALKRSTHIDRSYCGGNLNEDLLANTVVASRFQFLIIFSERESPQKQPALQVAIW